MAKKKKDAAKISVKNGARHGKQKTVKNKKKKAISGKSKKETKSVKKKGKEKSRKDPRRNHHKYLNEIGIPSTESCIFASWDDSDERQKWFSKQRKRHSFDERETWSLDYTLATWLYEHLMVYKDIAGKMVDLSYHEFELNKPFVSEDGKLTTVETTMTQEQIIDLACDYLEASLKSSWVSDCRTTYAQAALMLVNVVLPALWW